MKRYIAFLMVVSLTAPAFAKPKGCLTKAEIGSDLIVRHGVFLRETSDLCNSYQPGIKDEWKEFDQSFGPRLKGERDKRERAFKREFPDTWLRVITTFDAKMVTYDRNIWFTETFCSDVKDLLDDNKKKGWGSFVTQSKVIRDMQKMEFKPCE